MKNKKKSQFEESYFKGDGVYTSAYDYKIGNIKYLYQHEIRPLIKDSQNDKQKVLDIGCALGNLLHFFEQDKYETFGIDISRYALSQAKKNCKASLIEDNVNQKIPFPDRNFDIVTALDIIEHLDSPSQFLGEARRILRSGGLLFLHTPNINSIFEKLFRKNWFGYRDTSHLYLFNRKSLAYLVGKSGFKVVKNNTLTYPLPLSLRKLFKNTDLGGSIWLAAKKI